MANPLGHPYNHLGHERECFSLVLSLAFFSIICISASSLVQHFVFIDSNCTFSIHVQALCFELCHLPVHNLIPFDINPLSVQVVAFHF